MFTFKSVQPYNIDCTVQYVPANTYSDKPKSVFQNKCASPPAHPPTSPYNIFNDK